MKDYSFLILIYLRGSSTGTMEIEYTWVFFDYWTHWYLTNYHKGNVNTLIDIERIEAIILRRWIMRLLLCMRLNPTTKSSCVLPATRIIVRCLPLSAILSGRKNKAWGTAFYPNPLRNLAFGSFFLIC